MAEGATILADLPRVAEERIGPDELDARLAGADCPVVLRGLADAWPLVAAGRDGNRAARTYLRRFARDRNFAVQIGRPGSERVFYDADMGMDFRDDSLPLDSIFDLLDRAEQSGEAPLVYLASIEIKSYFDGLDKDNLLPLGARETRDGVWIGGRTRVAAHNDIANNVAVAAVGRRRFTLFPPDQFANLYLGPIDRSPGGRPISMVDFSQPDLAAFPRFTGALAVASVAELEAGDALFIPAMWYHHVEALDAFNVLVNYWWNDEPRYLAHPEDALFHAIFAIRDLPEASRAHWQAVFDHYVFSPGDHVTGHIPPAGRGLLAPIDPANAQRARAFLLRRLNQ